MPLQRIDTRFVSAESAKEPSQRQCTIVVFLKLVVKMPEIRTKMSRLSPARNVGFRPRRRGFASFPESAESCLQDRLGGKIKGVRCAGRANRGSRRRSTSFAPRPARRVAAD